MFAKMHSISEADDFSWNGPQPEVDVLFSRMLSFLNTELHYLQIENHPASSI